MWELVKAGGWLMLPLILCSILTVAISIERFVRLRRSQVLPKVLMNDGSADISVVITNLEQDTNAQSTALGNILKLVLSIRNMANNLREHKWKLWLLKKFLI